MKFIIFILAAIGIAALLGGFGKKVNDSKPNRKAVSKTNLDKLDRVAELKAKGHLTREEFEEEKRDLLKATPVGGESISEPSRKKSYFSAVTSKEAGDLTRIPFGREFLLFRSKGTRF